MLRALADREAQLRGLRHFLVGEEGALADALHADLGKSATEAYVTEIGFVVAEVDHALDHLHRWAQPAKVRLPLHLRPGSAQLVPEPLGTVLVIAPWNYPVQLLLGPLVPALAAGDTAVLKPSELAPATSALVAERLGAYLDERVVQVVAGDADVATQLLAQPWDHVVFTGSATAGRAVMRAAAEHLTPVTLELGGKSPAIVTASADIPVAARRLAWGKFLNAGQTCVAPDYVLADERIADRLVGALAVAIGELYGPEPRASADYGRIVNARHHERLAGLLDGGGFAAIAVGGDHDAADRYFAPTVLTGVRADAPVMADEIFGPILPVLTYARLGEAIELVVARPKPLALYVFAEDAAEVDVVVDLTSSGGVTVNHTLLHVAVPDLPFGGVGASGFGAYHGEAGFRRLSHHKPVLRRRSHPDPKVAYPPYTRLKRGILRRIQ